MLFVRRELIHFKSVFPSPLGLLHHLPAAFHLLSFWHPTWHLILQSHLESTLVFFIKMSVPFKKPSVAEQFGIKPNPNKIEHVMHGGVRLTKVLTSGGHPYDSSQNGFPIYHRRVANPWPIIALGTGASLLILGLIQVGHRGMTQVSPGEISLRLFALCSCSDLFFLSITSS